MPKGPRGEKRPGDVVSAAVAEKLLVDDVAVLQIRSQRAGRPLPECRRSL